MSVIENHDDLNDADRAWHGLSRAMALTENRNRNSGVVTPAILKQRVRVRDKGDYLVVEPSGSTSFHAIDLHIHGVGGVTADEMAMAETLAAGRYTLPVKVILPLADRMVKRRWQTNVAGGLQFARFAARLPKDMIPKIFISQEPTWVGQFQMARKVVTSPALWYLFKFKLDETLPVPADSRRLTYDYLVRDPVMRNLFPKLAPDIDGTIPDMLDTARKVGAKTDEMLLAEGANGHLKIIYTAFSQGVGMAAPKVLQHGHIDPRLMPSCLIAVGAPIILDCGMPEVTNRHIPVYNILPRADPVTRILGYGADRVRAMAEQHRVPIRVMEPNGEHGLCKPSARLAIAIIKREIEGPLPRRQPRVDPPELPRTSTFTGFFGHLAPKSLTQRLFSL